MNSNKESAACLYSLSTCGQSGTVRKWYLVKILNTIFGQEPEASKLEHGHHLVTSTVSRVLLAVCQVLVSLGDGLCASQLESWMPERCIKTYQDMGLSDNRESLNPLLNHCFPS